MYAAMSCPKRMLPFQSGAHTSAAATASNTICAHLGSSRVLWSCSFMDSVVMDHRLDAGEARAEVGTWAPGGQHNIAPQFRSRALPGVARVAQGARTHGAAVHSSTESDVARARDRAHG